MPPFNPEDVVKTPLFEAAPLGGGRKLCAAPTAPTLAPAALPHCCEPLGFVSLMPKEETAKQVEHAIEVTLKEPEWLKLERRNSEPLTIEQDVSSEEKDPQGRG